MDKVLESILLKSQYTPREMYEVLGKQGYIGQDNAKKAVCLMAYRHLNRLVKQFIQGIPRENLPGKENYLLIGPTGCGKTYLIELLFQHILEIPTVIVDITNFSETGYVGQDVPTVLTRLIHAADEDVLLASLGIVCLDEFDKISSGQNSAVFSGAGTTKDVTGIGVQRELLKMLESSDVNVPLTYSHSTFGDSITFNTSNVTFVACGAFSGFRQVLRSKEQNIGFGKPQSNLNAGISGGLSRQEVGRAVNFEAYGIMPELIGRFARIIPFDALSREDLRRILHENAIVKYRYELLLDGINLEVDEAVYDLIIDKCQELETGARAIKSHLVEYLEDACFEVYSSDKKHIHLGVEQGQIVWDLN